MQNIIFSNHALCQLAERGIEEQDARLAIISPDKIMRQSARRFQSVARMSARHALIVICDRFPERIEVVTAFKTSKLSKYL